MNEIKDIYKVNYGHYTDFRGTLRNERKFEYGQRVFIGSGTGQSISLYPAIIKGVKDNEDLENPSYIYRVKIPDWAVQEERSKYKESYERNYGSISWYKFMAKCFIWKYNKIKYDDIKYRNLSCDRIFTSIEQAKESIMKNHESMVRLERENINRYFDKFDKQNN